MALLVKDLLSNLLPNITTDWKQHLLREWSHIVGDLSCRMRLEKILSDDTLLIGVYNSSWLQEFYFLSHILINTINIKLGQQRIKNIKFKYVAPTPSHFSHFDQSPYPRKTTTISLNSIEQKALAHINDQELRTAMYQFLMRCHQERR